MDEVNYSEELAKENADHMEKELPKREHLLKWLDICVCEPEKRTGATSVKMQDTYIVYLVETKVKDPDMPGFGEPPTSLWRRYSEFELLRSYMEVLYSHVVIPPLPEKRVSYVWQKLPTDRFDPDFIDRRRIGLENFLLRVASHSTLSHDKMFHGFLKDEDGWRESVYATDFQNKADSKLRALSASFRLKKPDRRFEESKNYCNELQTHVNNILKIRARLADRDYGTHKIHANYGRVFSEWSGLEREMADGLQTAGHYMDVYSTSIESMLEDEEQFADQLKEYYAFGDSLRSVCRKQELLQLDLEKAEDNLSFKATQREQLVQGKQSAFSLSGMKTKLFGGDTPEQKELKIKQLEEQITEAEAQVKVATQEAQVFVDLALRDVDRFKRQKAKDLKDVFTNYALLQMERCRKVQGKQSAFSLSGMKTKLFGGDTPEQKELKIKQLEEQITEAEAQFKVATQEAQVFVDLALRDVDRFKRQKAKDLKDVFTNYALLQMERCRKNILVWQNVRDSFSKM